MKGFETKPVDEIREKKETTILRAAFAELPANLAMFIPADERKPEVLRTIAKGNFRRWFPERATHSQIDHDKDGIWFWWEPKE